MQSKKFTHTWEESVRWLRKNNEELSKSCYYDDPIELASERYYKSAEWIEVENVLKKKFPGKVLDVGAGRGISSYSFSRVGCEVYALEPDKSKLVGQGCIEELIQKTNSKITIVSDLKELSAKEGQFDIIYCRAALHHIPDLSSFFQAITKLLKRGGYFLATREHTIKNEADKEIFLNNHALHNLYGGENAYTFEQYTGAIQKFDLKLFKVFRQYDSIINYFPMKKELILAEILDFKLRSKWRFIPSFLLEINSPLKSYFMRSVNSFYYFPGTHCSFLAVKI